MKEKFIEWFTAGNSGYAPAIDADGKFEKEKTQHMWEAYQAGLASAEAQVKQLAAENVALKSFRKSLEDIRSSLIGGGHGYMAVSDMQAQNAVLDVVFDEFDGIDTSATDAAIASLRAEGVEMCIQALVTSCDDDFSDAPNICAEVARQLRSQSEGVQS